MKHSHTPGPWNIIPKGKPFAGDVGKDGQVLAQAYGNGHRANARLIAVAPELLAELMGMVAAWDNDPEGRIGVARMNDARALIAKATGTK